MFFTDEAILAIILTWKYAIIFFVAIIEGPLVSVISGFLCSQGIMSLSLVYPLLVAGDLVGDGLYYALGRWGRNGLLLRWGRYIGLDSQRIRKLENHFNNKRGGRTIFLSNFAHGFGTAFLTAAGAARMDFGRFLWYDALGTFPKSLLLVLAGYYFGSGYKRVIGYLDTAGWYMLYAASLFAVIYIIVILIARKLEKKD